MNTHNILLYEVKRRGNRLEELQVTLQDLIDLEMASPELQLQLQVRSVPALPCPGREDPRMPREGGACFPLPSLYVQTVRQLENNIEKMQVNIVTADKVHILYVKLLDVLRAVSPVLWPSSAGSLLARRGCWVLAQTVAVLLSSGLGCVSILGAPQD